MGHRHAFSALSVGIVEYRRRFRWCLGAWSARYGMRTPCRCIARAKERGSLPRFFSRLVWQEERATRFSYSIRVSPRQLDQIRKARQDDSFLPFSQYLCDDAFDDGFQFHRLAVLQRRLKLVSRELVT